MKISEIFYKNKNVNKITLSFEIFPPKKEEAYKNIDFMLDKFCKLKPDFISITFGAGGSSADNKSIEIARKLKNVYNIEPLVHLTCMHYSKSDIENMLEQLNKYNIENILALRGDINPEYPIKNDFHYANELAEFINEKGNFHLSGGCYPEKHIEAPDMATDIANLKRKVNTGVNHLITQLFFDNEVFYKFKDTLENEKINALIDIGIMPVTNKKSILKMTEMCGASIPQKLNDLISQCDDTLFTEKGIEYTINQINELINNSIDGIHIYTMNNPEVTRSICSRINI